METHIQRTERRDLKLIRWTKVRKSDNRKCCSCVLRHSLILGWTFNYYREQFGKHLIKFSFNVKSICKLYSYARDIYTNWNSLTAHAISSSSFKELLKFLFKTYFNKKD